MLGPQVHTLLSDLATKSERSHHLHSPSGLVISRAAPRTQGNSYLLSPVYYKRFKQEQPEGDEAQGKMGVACSFCASTYVVTSPEALPDLFD